MRLKRDITFFVEYARTSEIVQRFKMFYVIDYYLRIDKIFFKFTTYTRPDSINNSITKVKNKDKHLQIDLDSLGT